MNLPIIKLEVEGMKYDIQAALSQHQTKMDDYIQLALDEYCNESNLYAVVRDATRKALDQAIKNEVNRFFEYGEGYQAIHDAVKIGLAAAGRITE
jgi:hypothetical protein